MTLALRFAIGSIAIGVLVLAVKLAAYLMTDSIALLSDALETVVNIAAALAASMAIWLGEKPADANHPYGHHKAEYLSAVLEGVLIVVAALLIFREAYYGFVREAAPDFAPAGLGLSALASVINALWAWLLIRVGRRARSPALLADGRHLFTDVFSSVGVLIGLVLARVTGWTFLDPALAVLVGLGILWTGWELTRGSVSGLMDEAVEPAVLQSIRKTIEAEGVGAIEAHDLRTRRAGRATFIDFHLVVPGTMSVSDAHDICDRIERALREATPELMISIHVEPDNKAKHSGIIVV
jgi:cation diffusion facilitator family transporter